MSGAFSALIASTAKYGFIDNKGGKLTICPLYRNYKLAYTPDDATKFLREALLSPPLFYAIYDRFKGKKLPIEHFEKMLIKEFEVPDEMASRVAGYFLEGAKQAALLNNENVLVTDEDGNKEDEVGEDGKSPLTVTPVVTTQVEGHEQLLSESTQRPVLGSVVVVEDFWLNLRGPGMNFSIEIKDLDDLEIVQIMLKKIEKTLKSLESNAS